MNDSCSKFLFCFYQHEALKDPRTCNLGIGMKLLNGTNYLLCAGTVWMMCRSLLQHCFGGLVSQSVRRPARDCLIQLTERFLVLGHSSHSLPTMISRPMRSVQGPILFIYLLSVKTTAMIESSSRVPFLLSLPQRS